MRVLFQLQAYVQQLKFEKDQLNKQLHQLMAEHEQQKTCIMEELKRVRRYSVCVSITQ